MTSDVSRINLEDAVEALIDYRGKTPKKTTSGVPLITAKVIKNGEILEPNEFIAPENYDSWMVRGLPKVGDVVLTVEAPLGQVAQLTDSHVALAQRVVTLRGKQGVLDNTYLKYLLMSPKMQAALDGRSSGSTVKGIKQSELRKVELELPTIEKQVKVASILGALDDAISNNKAMNQTLEKIAQRIFKSWFIDFDPVKANKEGLPFDGLSPEIQALFPSEFEDSELGMIPKGWNIEPIQKLSKVAIGKTPPRKQTQWFDNKATADNTKWFSIKDMGTNGVYAINSSECLTNEAIDKFNVKVIPADTVLLSFKLTLGRLTITTEECATNEAIAHFKLDDKHDSLTTNFIYYYMKNFNFNLLGSTSSIATAINSKMVKEIPVLHSNKVLMTQFSKIVDPLMERIKLNSFQNDRLERIRDKLLPKLISGQISFGEAKQELKEAI